MSAHRDGRPVLEHLDDGGERRLMPVTKLRTLELWSCLARGDLEELLREPWKPGYLER
jgi:hypothetical protein